jgi:nitroimidazol reductase NimA-like FMN-containing flavoprotein (pyridoxamine 5'-phosphate oxidase superfamily)
MTEEPRKTYEELHAMAVEFLTNHRLGVLATGRSAGTPQQSIIAYSFDGDDVVVRTGGETAKVKNIGRRSGVSLAVTDGPTCVVVYGEARLLQGDAAEQYLGAGRPSTPPVGVDSSRG